MNLINNSENILSNSQYSSAFKKNQIERMNKAINIEELNNVLKIGGKTFENFIIREHPEQIMILLELINNILHDPRRHSGYFKHEYTAIIIIFFLGILSGYDKVMTIHMFGQGIWSIITSILEISECYPHYNTFRRVLNATNPEELAEVRKRWLELIGLTANNSDNNDEIENKCIDENYQSFFAEWIQDLKEIDDSEYIPPVRVCAQDGKLVRATRSAVNRTSAKDIISIYDVKTGEVLAESTVPKKTNEITENQNVINKLDQNEKYLISYDAMGCQKDLAKDINGRGWFYLFKVKDNQPTLKDIIELKFQQYGGIEVAHRTSLVGGHYTEWHFYVCYNTESLQEEWAGAKCIGMIVTYTERDNKISIETSYYIMNFIDVSLFIYSKIKHWQIENKLHHALDTVFHEDQCRVRAGNGTENLNILRKSALTFYRGALKYLNATWVSLNSLIIALRQSIFSINKCIELTKKRIIFSLKDITDEAIII